MDIKDWVNNLIDMYNKAETPDVYQRRTDNESKNIKTVLECIKKQHFSASSITRKTDFIQLLKAADVISLSVGPNFLEQFLQIPDVQAAIVKNLSPQNVEKGMQRARENEAKGMLPTFGETIAEKDKKYAETYLSSPSLLTKRTAVQEVQRFERHIDEIQNGIFSVKTNATSLQEITENQNLMLRLGRVLLRQRGNNPGIMELYDGSVGFKMDVPEKEPIFHGLRQEQGFSAQQLAEIQEQQDAEYIRQEEERRKNEQARQAEQNEMFSHQAEARRKQQEQDKYASKRASFSAKIDEPTNGNSPSKAFLESLKCNTNNKRTTMHQQAHRQARGMGMSR